MIKIILLIATVVFLMIPGKALSQQTETWQGVEWECATTGGIDVIEETVGIKYLSLLVPDSGSTIMAYYWRLSLK